MKFIYLYFIAIACFLMLDGLWLGLIAKGFYSTHLGYLFTEKFNFLIAGLFYLIYAAGIIYFVVSPNMGTPIWKVFLIGAFLGILAYGAYDFTNHATIKDWPWIVTIVDILWGGFVTGSVSSIVVFLSRYLS